jgi:hypothetical protein
MSFSGENQLCAPDTIPDRKHSSNESSHPPEEDVCLLGFFLAPLYLLTHLAIFAQLV